MTPASSEYRFDRFRLLPHARALLCDDEPVKLGGRAYDTLLALVEHHDRAVSKQELMDRVWPKLVVEENNLQVQIASLRKALGASAISTIPGRGYRFTLPVVTAEPPQASAVERAPEAGARKDNLPPLPGPLYGRDDDVAALLQLLDAHALVSIVGAGGIGKTRLALSVAHAVRNAYADGVWLVELAPINDPALVIAGVASVFGVSGRVDATPDTLAEALAARSLLLVLDNCEHVLDAVATLTDALSRRAPRVRLLVTSQELLKVASEHVYRLDPLALPASAEAKDAQRHGAVAMFLGRVRAAHPRFALEDAQLPAVLEICRRLEGIPLALELAAARVPLLGVEGLRARLDERFNVLTGGSRFALRRHQTLRAALDFSHGLLDERERAVFRRLSVFAGSFAAESAQQVCADDALDRWDALECLGALVDKSLVVAESGAEPRLRLLETTRAYALEKLADAGETPAVLERHAQAIRARMRPAYDDFWKLSLAQWLAHYGPELDNLRAAIDYAMRHAPELAIELMGDSLKVWQELALQPEALRRCEAALALVTPNTPARAAGRLWYADAMMCANTWGTRSRDSARRAVALLRESGDQEVLAFALTRLAGATRSTPTPEQWAALDELERMERPEWRGQLRWLASYARAWLHRNAGNFTEARAAYERTCEIARHQGERDTDLRTLVPLAEVIMMEGDLDRAIAILRDVVVRLEDNRDRLFYAFATVALTSALLLAGRLDEAREPFEAAVPFLLRYDLTYRFAEIAALYAALAGDLTTAAHCLGHSIAGRAAHQEPELGMQHAIADARVRARLERFPASQVDAWIREGQRMTDEQVLHAAVAAGRAAAR
jgi:predicted ATPase/DNA-binding winged helix-turn-helix (wHTH) protein